MTAITKCLEFRHYLGIILFECVNIFFKVSRFNFDQPQGFNLNFLMNLNNSKELKFRYHTADVKDLKRKDVKDGVREEIVPYLQKARYIKCQPKLSTNLANQPILFYLDHQPTK